MQNLGLHTYSKCPHQDAAAGISGSTTAGAPAKMMGQRGNITYATELLVD